jgi:hypothetical protein
MHSSKLSRLTLAAARLLIAAPLALLALPVGCAAPVESEAGGEEVGSAAQAAIVACPEMADICSVECPLEGLVWRGNCLEEEENACICAPARLPKPSPGDPGGSFEICFWHVVCTGNGCDVTSDGCFSAY